jgi:hypothetical protein
MFERIRRLFTRNSRGVEPFDYTPMVEQLLTQLPRCTRDVIVISPDYGNPNFSCEVHISALDLLTQAVSNERVWSSCDKEQTARLALPIWLREADMLDVHPTLLHPDFQELMAQYPWALIDAPSTRVFCPVCNSYVNNVNAEQINKNSLGGWRWWTDIWTCPAGHQLRHEEHEVHFLIRPD